ncbi:Crp/Fnr family transcriptional regulator [Aminobacter ciceronei]|nr:helix-turn-helix domain-containing protein [Aminobacter ciceronei]
MAEQEMILVVRSARRAELKGQCWLQNYASAGELIAIVTSGCIGLRPVVDDLDSRLEILSRNAPAIVDLTESHEVAVGHWLVDASTVYFYTEGDLEAAFECSARFACNFVDILRAQYSAVMLLLDDTDRDGLRRLGASLLARAERSATKDQKLRVTQSQLASETGLSRQWVNRLLKRLERKGIAELGRGHVQLRAPGRLLE